MSRIIFALLVIGTPAVAEPHAWAPFFADQPTQGAQGTQQQFDMGTGVVLWRNYGPRGWHYFGMDKSGAVGCTAMILLDIEAIHRKCDILAKNDADSLDRLIQAHARFYAENALPATTEAEFNASREAHFQRKGMVQCGAMMDVLEFSKALFSSESVTEIEQSLARPRLPVNNPCL